MMDYTSLAALWWAVIFLEFTTGLTQEWDGPCSFSSTYGAEILCIAESTYASGAGHLVAMIAILAPFTMMIWLIEKEYQIRIGANLIVIGMGIYLLINPKHPRYLARVHPAKLGLWSFYLP